MPSPFPGMNPYLEQDDAWHDFHEKFLPAVAERLVPQVRPDYIVKIDEHVYVHELPHEPRHLVGRADVSVGLSPAQSAGRPAANLLEAPNQVHLPAHDIERLAFVEIRDRHGRELVTVIELLSPSNKRPGSDREQYLAKRQTLLDSRVHLVEIDLLRGGRPMPLDDRPDCSYSVLVSRVEERPQAGFWPVALQARLPLIPIPLRPSHGDVPLDLQEILNRIYDASSYADYIYEGSPDPPLTPAEADWARTLVPRPGQ
ncbi:MAG TPA: DUF4058 family protein [Isosphaeraceae bacterium]|nr:DUF4058 family protein [Isosphaeraceae bacterium]